MVRAPSIRSQLRRFIVLVLLGAVVCGAGLVTALYRSVDSEERSRLAAIAEVTVTAAEATAETTRELMAELSSRPDLRDEDPNRCAAFLRQAVGVLPRYLVATVTDTSGRVRCSSAAAPPAATVMVTDRVWFREVQRRDTFVVGPPVEGRLSQTSVIVFAHPVRDDSGTTVGFLTLSSPTLDRFRELVDGLGDEETVVTIATEEGLVVARSHDSGAWVGRMLPASGEDIQDGGDVRGVSRAADGEGVPRMWVYRNLPQYGWRVFAGTSQAALRTRAAARITPLLALLLTLLGTLAWLMFRLRHSVNCSLTELVTAMRRSGSDPSLRAPTTNAPAEVAAVADQFNRTLAELDDALAGEEAARRRLQSILNNAFFGIFVCDGEGRILGCNPAMTEMLGYGAEEEVTALTVAELFMVPEQARELLASPERHRGLIEAQWRRTDGRMIPVRLHWAASSEPGGSHVVQGIAEDLTERRELEVQFRQAQKLEAVGRLAGGMAHDFNNRLTVINGQAELLLSELAGADPRREYAEGIITSARRAARLTAQLLAFSRRQPLSPERLDVSRVAAKLVPVLEQILGTGVALQTSWEAVPDILADVGQMEQVLLNLVTNARDAVGEEGTITLRSFTASLSAEEAGVRGPEVRAGVHAVLSVADDGPGMEAPVMDHIFEPFFTTKPTGKGTGLGLATVYGIATQYGGHVRVDSAPGAGARFEVWLPALGQDSARTLHIGESMPG